MKLSICPLQCGFGFYTVLQYSYYNYKKSINIALLLEYFFHIKVIRLLTFYPYSS